MICIIYIKCLTLALLHYLTGPRPLMISTKKHLMNAKYVVERFCQELLKFIQDHVNQSQTLEEEEVEAKMDIQGE